MTRTRQVRFTLISGLAALSAGFALISRAESHEAGSDRSRIMTEEGRHTFRYDTFGDEAFWGGTLQLHQAIAGSRLGGVGPGVSPRTAWAVGLKVDVEALPGSL